MLADLQYFSSFFGLPAPKFKKVIDRALASAVVPCAEGTLIGTFAFGAAGAGARALKPPWVVWLRSDGPGRAMTGLAASAGLGVSTGLAMLLAAITSSVKAAGCGEVNRMRSMPSDPSIVTSTSLRQKFSC